MQARKNAPAATRRPAGVEYRSATTTIGTRKTRRSVSTFGSAMTRAPPTSGSATGLEDTRPLAHVGHPVAQDAGEVFTGLGDGGNATRILDPSCARVVGGDRQRQVAPVAVEQHAQMADT